MGIQKKDVPWVWEQSSLFRTWEWNTPHFKALIISEGQSNVLFSWKITDYTNSRSGRDLASGQAISYTEAVDAVLEVIGKSYPPKLQYREYAGTLATTFTIGSNEVIDFGKLEARRVTLLVKDGESIVPFSGALAVVHYSIHLTTDSGQIVKIPPQLIQEVREEFSSTAIKGKDEKQRRNERARIYPGNWVQGCTGANGFEENTVVHDPLSSWCPIHENSL